jgi:hypothetical protein
VIRDSYFEVNAVESFGSTVFVDKATIDISRTNFTQNYQEAGTPSVGCVLYSICSERVVLRDSYFTGHNCPSLVEAFCSETNSTLNSIFIDRSVFTDNTGDLLAVDSATALPPLIEITNSLMRCNKVHQDTKSQGILSVCLSYF